VTVLFHRRVFEEKITTGPIPTSSDSYALGPQPASCFFLKTREYVNTPSSLTKVRISLATHSQSWLGRHSTFFLEPSALTCTRLPTFCPSTCAAFPTPPDRPADSLAFHSNLPPSLVISPKLHLASSPQTYQRIDAYRRPSLLYRA